LPVSSICVCEYLVYDIIIKGLFFSSDHEKKIGLLMDNG
jgi:hypothetical protein